MGELYLYFPEILETDLQAINLSRNFLLQTLRKLDYDINKFTEKIIEFIKTRITVNNEVALKLMEILVRRFSQDVFCIEWSNLKYFLENFRKFVNDKIYLIARLAVDDPDNKTIENFLKKSWKDTKMLRIIDQSEILRAEIVYCMKKILKSLRDIFDNAKIKLNKDRLLLVLYLLKIDPRNLVMYVREMQGIPVIVDEKNRLAITSLENARKIMQKFRIQRKIAPKKRELLGIISMYPKLSLLLNSNEAYLTSEKVLFIFNHKYNLALITTIEQ